jgi:hypothetical protein
MITIRYNSDWEEFQVTVTGNPRATHHTDCPIDALGSAQDMAKRSNSVVTVHHSAKSRINKVKGL